ncbi:MAG: diguanylate cyclase [Desulfuromonadales bacterium]|nr:diguanylate cyclase [Desulfuromonadales bacterium]
MTASIGISEYQSGDTFEQLIKRADQAMYYAKATGRNKVCYNT